MFKTRRFALLLSLAMVAACASGGASSSDSPAPSATAAPVADATLSGRSFVADMNGLWRMQFGEDNRINLRRDNTLVYEGTYAITGDQLRITDRRGDMGCPGAPAVYTWKLHGELLELRRRTDPCGTSHLFQNARWEQRR
jgi:hypothetical protein